LQFALALRARCPRGPARRHLNRLHGATAWAKSPAKLAQVHPSGQAILPTLRPAATLRLLPGCARTIDLTSFFNGNSFPQNSDEPDIERYAYPDLLRLMPNIKFA